MYKFINKHDILYQSQYGFRNKHSCEQAILELTDQILHARDDSLHTVALFLDLSKAFDTLNHDILLQKLYRYGIRGVCLDWFQDYLTNHSLISKITTPGNVITRSESYDITYGTAQGSCLGPLLFILFCNDIYLLPTFSKIILFADDTTLVNSAKNENFLRYTLEHDMLALVDWYKANQLSLNIDKIVLIKFWPNNDKEFRIKIGQIDVINQSHTKFLGVIIDDQLSWREHCNTLYNKLLVNKCLLQNAQNLLPMSSLLGVYYAHVYSHIMYGLSVWGTMISKTQQKRLYKVQNACVRIIANMPKNFGVDALYKSFNVIRFPDLIKQEQYKLGYKISCKILPEPIIALFDKKGGKKCHRYPTRNKNTPNIQKHTNPQMNSSFLCQSVNNFMQLPGITKKCPNLSYFCNQIKKMLKY